MSANDSVYKDKVDALIVARNSYPDAEVFVDDREHIKLSNGMVMIEGEQDLTPVEFK